MASLQSYRAVQSSLSVKLRGTNQQTDIGLLHVNSPISGKTGDPVRRVQGYQINYWRYLSTNASNKVALGTRIPNYMWMEGSWTNASTTFTDQTAAAQNTTVNDFTLGTTSTNNDGFVVLSSVPFNCVSMNVGTAGSGTSQVAAARFSDGVGGWTIATATGQFLRQDGAATFYGTGENILFFLEPVGWRVTTGAEGTNIPSGYYAMNMRSTTAPTTGPGLGNSMEVWRMYMPHTSVGANAKEELPGQLGTLSFPYGDALMAYSDVVTNVDSVFVSFSPGGAFGGA